MHMLFERSIDGSTYFSWLMSGVGWTLSLWISSGVIAFLIGIPVGAARTSRSPALRVLGRLYVQVFRNIPLLVQAFLWYFVLPDVLPSGLGAIVKQIPPPWGSFIPALAALSLYTASRIAEQVRSGITALPAGQRQGADALGLSPIQTYMRILIPQALRITVPTLTSEVLALLKNTSIALTIGLLELTAQAQQINEFTFETFQAFAAATVMYLVIALLIHLAANVIERAVETPGTVQLPPTKR
ncbi:amino acid ABC transporter permease [Pandoraea anhela]|uniref:Amino acid ABC transporter permease n=1 Tax=Pandoraea anhela TaxID=2508295 RepID=A0A5E4WAN2_9BURK|nr:amino acid ABC transporter permease [Pandoraea anhela]VVE22087.1 amino acid ABC transporter permease [Pandoraea anhela]